MDPELQPALRPREGWPTPEQREASRCEGERLAERAQDAVGPEVTIDLHLWEVHVDEPRLPR
ncbi:hypothetical protein KRH_01760 [Kocuria rhizophila DC2201]|uniref:Uncharacterized protein n=1 Tax=Kocuria rhizophila (strain ATCC 9341 / DSM 348 / NBRC 103217 / DC2201) TaxID=378753 RepID=B2GKY6_KOCRD|nr:hypothetical protein KRH_01760 [Kocuria rhizophila DC2201]